MKRQASSSTRSIFFSQSNQKLKPIDNTIECKQSIVQYSVSIQTYKSVLKAQITAGQAPSFRHRNASHDPAYLTT